MAEESEKTVQEISVNQNKNSEKKKFSIKLPSFFKGDQNVGDDWKFGLAFFVSMPLLVFWDIVPALVATIALFFLYSQLEKSTR